MFGGTTGPRLVVRSTTSAMHDIMVSCLPRSRGGGDVVNYDATPIVDLDTDYIYFYDYTQMVLWSDGCPHLFAMTFEIMHVHILVQ